MRPRHGDWGAARAASLSRQSELFWGVTQPDHEQSLRVDVLICDSRDSPRDLLGQRPLDRIACVRLTPLQHVPSSSMKDRTSCWGSDGYAIGI